MTDHDRNRIVIVSCTIILLIILISDLYYCPCHCYYPKTKIEQYLDKTSESILLNSENDTAKVHKIIAWENNNLSLTSFKPYQLHLRQRKLCFSSDKVYWSIYLGKANCEERAVIFEDMARRTDLEYRRVVIDGFIDPKNNCMNNHRWSEVELDGDWRIADSGFNLSYPEDNQSHFTSEDGYLIGHVAIINDDGTFGDCTDLYVRRTGKLGIQVVKGGEFMENAAISIKLTYKNISCPVVGGNTIKRSTNEYGHCEINLGIYDGTYYTVKVSDKDMFYEYFGQENITITNETNSLVIELDKQKRRWGVLAVVFIGAFILLFFVIAVSRRVAR